mgnify:CR=1 FL=1
MLKIKLIALYYQVCDLYNSTLQWNVQRFSPNKDRGLITDEELITIYLFAVIYQQRTEKKQIYTYTKDHWESWFPNLPSYQTFNDRLNRLTDAFILFSAHLLSTNTLDANHKIILGDSMPIITCSGKRTGKVAPEMTDKSYCASKDLWYYGVKLHLLAAQRKGKLPIANYLKITPASGHDLEAVRDVIKQEEDTSFVLDKAYCDALLAEQVEQQKGCLFTPQKNKRGESEQIRQMEHAFKKQLNTAVAKVRQPIESLFNWIHQKTDIQNANKVRSKKGLLLHIFGKLTAAFIIFTQF